SYVCWKPEGLDRVLKTVATSGSDALFLATHEPMKMKVEHDLRPLAGTQNAVITEEQLRQRLMSERNDYPFELLPVVGDPGSGKSHLIRWLKANIPESTKRSVLFIPRENTSLRDIILH